MLQVSRLRSALASPTALLAVASIAVALLSLWTISIPKVKESASFGFESPVCWLAVLALLGALLLPNLTLSTISLVAAELVLIGWYGWAMWLVTIPRFSSQYDFVGTDYVAPAWYAAGLGLLFAAAVVARRFRDHDDAGGAETWWLAAVPGYGLLRLGKIARGITWTVLVVTALVLASLASPIAPLFQPLNGIPELPSPLPTRAATWILLGTAVFFAVLSVADTILMRRRLSQR